MALEDLINRMDSGIVEEITIYVNGHKKIYNLRDIKGGKITLPFKDNIVFRFWNSETGKGISVLLCEE